MRIVPSMQLFPKLKNPNFLSRGVNLVELLVVVAIVSILLVIAVPTYLEEVNSNYRAECRNSIVLGAQLLERQLIASGKNEYPPSYSQLVGGVAGSSVYSSTNNPNDRNKSACQIDYIRLASTPTEFTLTATPIRKPNGRAWSNGECVWTIDHRGYKDVERGQDKTKCWTK